METIGKYRIIGGLGKGGFGQVYKAEDPTIGSVVAIKVLNVQNDEAMLRRFRAEAVTSAKLRHKNIVTIFDFEEQNGKPYLVMEYLDGDNLQRLLETKERVPILDKLSIMAEVAEGLQYAHEHGVIHRDIKPANIMRLRDGSVKIMDFGIARLTQRNTRLTAVGYLVGTPEYMAPEQFMSDGTDSQCDIWAYGVVLYEFLSGHNPFSADSPGAVIYRVTNEEPPAICDRVRELPHSLDPVMRRLLAKKKTERYPSMEDVLLDLGPAIQEFGESQVAGMEKSAESLIRSGKYDEALAAAARILKFDQKNTRARKWRADLRDLSRRQKEEARIKVLIEEADQKTTLLDFSAAEARLKEALQIDPANSAARTRLEQLNVAREKKLRAQNLLTEARVEFGQQNLTSAFEHATEAAQSDPASADATEFLRQVRKAIEKRDWEARRKAGLSKSRGMLLIQDYAGAVNTLQELARQYPDDSEVRARLDEALHLQAVDATEKKAAAAIAKSRDYLVKGAFQDAIDLLSGLDPDAGRNVQVLQLLSYARDQREQQKREAEVEKLLAAAAASQGDYERALASIDRALELSPGNERALRLRKAVLANRQRDEENKAIEGELTECRSLMSADRLEHAETRARALWKRHPEHPGVQQIIRDLGERFRQREEAIEREIESRRAELERLLDRGDVEAAAGLLKTISARYQRENLFADLSRRIARMETEKREQEAVNAILARAQRLGDGGYWDDARLAIDLGLKQFPKSAALMAQRERVLQQAELQTLVNEIQRQIANEDWESVVNAAESGLRKFPGDPRLTELLQAAREEREWKELLNRTESLIVAGDLAEADKTIAELARRGRDNASVVRLLRMLGDKRQRQQSLAAADQFRKRFSFQQARDVLQTILNEDRDDTAARTLLEAVDREQSAYTRGQEVAAARAEAGRLSRQKEYAAAVGILTAISNAYPGDFEIEEDLRNATKALEQATIREAYSRGRDELAALVKNREFDRALQKAEELIARFPDHSELRDELRRVREARDQAFRKQAYEEGRGEVAALMKSREFDRAIGKLQELASAFPEEPEVEDELRRARATREQVARKEEYARGRKQFEELVRNRQFDRAVSAAERLSIAFPEEPELQEDLRRARAARDQARRKIAYTRRREGFDALMADRQFDLAVNAVEGLSRDFPEEPELQELLRHASEARDRARRKEAYARGCQDFEVLMRDRQFEQAVTAAQQLLTAFPEEDSSELLRGAREAREEAERKEAYARGCQDFEVLMRDRKFEQAVTAAQQLVTAFPGEESAELVRRAREAHEKAERKRAYARGCQDFEVLMRDGKFAQAVTAAEGLIAAFPEQQSAELLRRARQSQEEAERKQAYAHGCQDFEVLMRDGKFAQAVTAAEGLMAAFPEQQSAELLRRARQAHEEAERKQAYARGRQDFEVLMRDGKFAAAVTAAEGLIAAFPEQQSAELLRRARQAHEEAERKQAYARGRQDFEVLMRDGKFAAAVTAAEGLIAASPEQQSAELLRRARQAHEEAERKQAYARGRQDFEVLMRDGKFAAAVTAAEGLIMAFPEQESAELLRRACETHEKAERKQAYARGRQDFEVLMRERKFEEAITAARQLMTAFPEDPDGPELLRDAQSARELAGRKDAYSRAHQDFEALMRERKFDRAVVAAQQLIEAFPEEQEAAEFLRRAGNAREEAARKEAYKRGCQDFEVLMRDGKFEPAVASAHGLIAAFPKEPEGSKFLRRAEKARDEAARKEAYQRGCQDFETLMSGGKFEQAVAAAQQLIKDFPKEPKSADLLRRARDARDEAARKEAYKRGSQDFETLLRDGRFEQAITVAEQLIKDFSQEPAADLLRRAQDAYKTAYQRGRQAFDVLLRDGKFEEAAAAARQLIAAFPKESEAPELLHRAGNALQEAARKKAYQRDRQALDALMRAGKFEQAVTAAQALVAAFPKEPEAAELLRRAVKARDEAAYKEALERDRQAFEVLMRDGKFEQAVTAAERFSAAYPKEPEAAKLVGRAQDARKEAYQRGRQAFEACMRDGKFEQAVAAAQAIVSAFPKEPDAAELLRRAQDARGEAARREALQRGCQAFESLMRESKFEEAVTAARQLVAAFPKESQPPEFLRRAEEAVRKDTYRRDRQAIDVLMRDSKFAQAVTAAERLTAAYQDEPEAPELLRRAQNARDEAARKEAYQRDRQAFDVLMRDGKCEQAVTAAQQLITNFPQESELPELLRRALDAREEAARKEAYKRDRQAFDVLMRDSRFAQAVTAAQQLIAVFPQEPEPPELLRRAEKAAREEAYQRDRQAFEALMRDSRFEQAVAAAERMIAAYPEEPALLELAHRAREARDEAARKAAYARGRQDFEALLVKAQFDQAIAKARELIAAFPTEPDAPKHLERAFAAQAEAARKAAFLRGHKEFDALMRQRQFDQAIAKARELATVFPEESVLKDDLKRAIHAREQARREQIYEPGRKEFDALMKSGRLEEAIKKAETLVKEFSEDQVVQQDLQSARAALEARKREAELDRQAAEVLRRARQLRLQRAVTEALELVQKSIQELGNRPGLRELQEQLLADQARTRLARQTLDKARNAVEQGQVEAAEKLASELETNLSGEVDTSELRAAIGAKAEELRVRAAIEGFAREAENLRSQARFDEALQSLGTALQQFPGTQVLIAARERVEKDRQEALRRQAREQALAEISTLPQSVQSAPDESALREIVARADAIAAAYPGDKQFKPAAQAVNKAAKRRRTEFARVAGAATAPLAAAPLWKRPIAVAGIAAGVLAGAAGIWWLAGSRSVALQISTDPAGAKVTAGSMSCTTPQCTLRLAPGNYEIRAEKAGYRAASATAAIGKGAPAPVALTLIPLPARLSVGANFTKATIAFDGSQLGQLRNGEFALDSVPEGAHTLDVRSSDGQATLRFEYKAGQPPKILAPPSGTQIQAVVVSGYASTAEVQCDCESGEVTVDGKSAGQLQNHRLALTGLASGTHQLRVSAPDGIRESVVSLQDSPSINLYVAADLDVGTLVVETGQDGVQVLLDNRPQPTLTQQGIVRIPVPSKQYSVSVAKQGFRAPAAKSIEVKKGQLQRVSFELIPLESTLDVRAGLPGVRVQIDGQTSGVTGPDGSLRIDNIKPGTHTIDLTKDGYTPRPLTNFKFEPGKTVTLGREVQLTALPTPTPAQPTPTVTPTPPPDPRAVEAEEWHRLAESHDVNKLLEFIGKHPGDSYSTQAAARVEQIEWDNLQNSADPSAWEAFANKYPKSDRAGQARKRAEQMEWSRVDKQKPGQIRAFLQRHPGNPDATAALNAAEQVERLAADKRAISQVLTQYQQAFTSKNIDGLLALRPSLKGTPTEKNIREAFRQKQSIVLELTPLRDADVSGDTAAVQCRQSTQNQQGTDKVPQAFTVTVTLGRSGQSWVIKDIH